MTTPEYIQLRAFARVDGLKLFGLWLMSFVCYLYGLRMAGLGLVAMILAFMTPFLSYRLLRRFRDEGLNGVISFGRGWLYVVFQFFYAGLLFAIIQFLYFTFLDKGYFMDALSEMFSAAESQEAMKLMGLGGSIDEALEMYKSMRPIDLALNILMSNMLVGMLLGVPIAAFAKRDKS